MDHMQLPLKNDLDIFGALTLIFDQNVLEW